MIVYFDTETSGLFPGQICQLSYIIEEDGRTVGKNMYMSVDHVEKGAQIVHGLSVEKLHTLSGGRRFSDYAGEIYEDFCNADLVVAHNFSFDLQFMTAEFERLGLRFTYKNSLCTMRHFTSIVKLTRHGSARYKYPKLQEFISAAGVWEDEMYDALSELFGLSQSSFHDARADTAGMYLALRKYAQKEKKVLELLSNYR